MLVVVGDFAARLRFEEQYLGATFEPAAVTDCR